MSHSVAQRPPSAIPIAKNSRPGRTTIWRRAIANRAAREASPGWPDIVDESLAAQMTRQRYRLKNGNPTPETYSCVKPASPFPEPWMPSRQCQLHTIVLSRVLSGDLPVVLPVAVQSPRPLDPMIRVPIAFRRENPAASLSSNHAGLLANWSGRSIRDRECDRRST